jgi:hypothetical protein
MLMLALRRKQIGSTEYEDVPVAFHWETVRRVEPCNEGTVLVTFDDGETMPIVGSVTTVAEEVNMMQQGTEQRGQVEYLG